MVKLVEYRCNLCGTLFKPGDGVGVWHGGGPVMQFTEAFQMENHLCNDCLKALPAALAERKDP